MKNYAKQQTDAFCTGQTLILCSDSHDLLHNGSDDSELIGKSIWHQKQKNLNILRYQFRYWRGGYKLKNE